MTSADRDVGPGPIATAVGPLGSGIRLRPVSAADDIFVRALFHADRAPQFAGVPEPMLTMLLDQQFRSQQLGYRQAFPRAEHLVIVSDGQSVGRVIVAVVGDGERRVLHFVDIVVAETMRGHGIGAEVMTSLGRSAQTLGATSMTLAVLSANTRARRLYERLGFIATGDDGVRTAMVRPLS
ncbi:GNAT family N-acetyltransferase [Bradyrhizobium sp. U87765 SZCCT0131]|uniref:GNAT family N-acetyltransferase n=1 Tax=unclassified Bradyrhizobium TaxID=2631580 RepID=UPI001BA9D265|nr:MULTISPECIES: GNAT family N-acetyltransferase [unclassified Bradyrhizobium]MBR1220305.1 GNAT family N-acetyltransferase [Bradyrhizobium sp. U87765 SZCCT0131]MBR1263240.1 GNAT family N-acetyltransferase [Bradyrhizobium sp. U87765 SZCCT0134]MBR1306877.1 GNAT family N-acetyltransferase [Bradyrhizobium sp. U87765 SZCCT0110]MBR1323376.1 GNAT family N-acetyltransferase [Bradyrhizobium sp. U87765 SZCCT0109]MBR1345831.1 GNAT family N-acetyltransferase [Bradyrhizobium sp. U87765 SZCCT0048]